MTYENKKKCREIIEKEGWKRYGGIIDDEPSVLYWNNDRELKIMFEDMDGNPHTCKAKFIHEEWRQDYFIALDGFCKGNHMDYVFAYKEL